MPDFDTWAKTDNDRIVLVQLHPWTGSAEESLYMGSEYYLDGTTEYEDRLIDPLVIERSLSGAFTGRGQANVGGLTFNNSDRELDDWLDYAWQGRDVTILVGDPSWDIGDFKTFFSGVTENAEGDDTTITILTRDLTDKLDRPIVERPLNPHPEVDLEPFPLCIGHPKNVTPPIWQILGSTSSTYVVNAWDANVTFDAVYENGATTGKTIVGVALIGGGAGGFRFSVNDSEGQVTCDAMGGRDAASGGSRLFLPGETLERVLTWDIKRESGVIQAVSGSDIVLEANASSVDDFYTGAGSSFTDTGFISIKKRNTNNSDSTNVTGYVGGTRTATIDTGSLSVTPEVGDVYDIVPSANIPHGPLTASDLDSAAFTALDTDAPYTLGIWSRAGDMTYLDLLDRILPGGFYYYWTRESKLTVGLLEEPGTSVLTIDTDETHNEIVHVQEQAPVYRVRVGYNRNWTVMSAPDSGVSADRAGFLTREYIWEFDQDLSVLDEFPNVSEMRIGSFLTEKHNVSSGGKSDAQTEAQRLMTLFGTARKRIGVNTFAAPFSIDLHDTVTLKDDNYGLSSGVDFRVVGITEFPLEGRCELELWG